MEEPQRSSGQDVEAGIEASRGTRDAAETLVGAVVRAGHPWRFVPAGSLAGEPADPALRTWPLVLPDGELLGMVVRQEGGSDRHDELLYVLLRNFATVAATESAARDAQRRAREAEAEARVDALTGLPNRRAWDEALEAEAARMARHGRASIVIVLDLDDLKVVNDTEGHLAGDLLIRRAALAVRRAVRDEDVVARIGGDELAILAVEAADADAILQRLHTALDDLHVAASTGAAIALPGTSLRDAFDSADREMYETKRHRKATVSP